MSECKERPAAFLLSLPFLCEDITEPHIEYWKVERESVGYIPDEAGRMCWSDRGPREHREDVGQVTGWEL